MSFATDDDFTQYLNDKAADIETANQNVANAALGGASGKPMFAQKNEDGISKGVADYVASLKPFVWFNVSAIRSKEIPTSRHTAAAASAFCTESRTSPAA